MFSIVSIELSGLSFGSEVAGIGLIGDGGPVSREQVSELSIPWQPLQKDPGVFSLLSWHSRISSFQGREREMSELERWAESNLPVSVKFVVGEGGIGKSRLGAEFAEHMKTKKWSAGFLNLRRMRAFPLHRNGTLLIIDYPEEQLDRVTELLNELATISLKSKLRILLLTRQSPEKWGETISLANARNIVEKSYLILGPIDTTSAKRIFDSTVERAGDMLEHYSTDELGPGPIPIAAMKDWLSLSPIHNRALFVMAAAVHSAAKPKEEIVSFAGREVVTAISHSEIDKLIRLAEKEGFQDRMVYARLLAIAAISGELSISTIRTWTTDFGNTLEPKLKQPLERSLEQIGLLSNGRIRLDMPAVVAAAYVTEALRRDANRAPELIWRALGEDLEAGLERVNRLIYDAEVVLGIRSPSLQRWLVAAIDGKIDRSYAVYGALSKGTVPFGLLELAQVAVKTILTTATDHRERAELLNNLSVYLGDSGKSAEGLEAVRESVNILRGFAKDDAAESEDNLARALGNYSIRLEELGYAPQAIETITEAVKIRRKLAAAQPTQHERDLALSLNNLSVQLLKLGHAEKAVSTADEAVEIRRRRLDIDGPNGKANLAISLKNLSLAYSELAQTERSLNTISEAVEIYRELALSDPARYEPDLASCLHTFSNALNNMGVRSQAVETIKEAVNIRRRLAAANPSRFQPDLAISLNNQSNYMADLGNSTEAIAVLKEGIQLLRQLSIDNPLRYERELAYSLYNLAIQLYDARDVSSAKQTFEEAIAICRRLAENYPARYLSLYASMWADYANILGDIGEAPAAKAAIESTLSLLRPFVEKEHGKAAWELTKVLEVLGRTNYQLGEFAAARRAFEEALQVIRRYATAKNSSEMQQMFASLEAGLVVIQKTESTSSKF
jgi:tetratricopeptide (TPR) repeat protein